MNNVQAGKASSKTATQKKNPDVIVTHANQTVLFKVQNRRASEWLREHYHSSTGGAKGDTEIRVHPTRCKRIVEELKSAGFEVITL